LRVNLVIPVLASILIIGTIGFTSQSVDAYTADYQPFGVKLKHHPTICALEPQDPELSNTEIEKLMEQARGSTLEWEAKLKSAESYRQDKDFWTINYVKIVDALEISDESECDIKIFFESQPTTPLYEHSVLGIADLDPLSDTWDITIYYLQTKLNCGSEIIGKYLYRTCKPFYTENLRSSSQLGNTARHEIGHAFGLGHYAADDVAVNLKWSEALVPAPSIMVLFSDEVSSEQNILSNDVNEMRSIYGENGFEADADVDDFSTYKAKIFIEKDYFDEALSYVKNYLQSNPDDEELLHFKGQALWGLDRYSKAETIIDQILAINPEHEGALYIKGKALAKSENYDEALEFLDKVLEINPKNDEALSYKGLIFYKQVMYNKAGKFYDLALDVNRFNPITWLRSGNLWSDMGSYEDAIEFYDIALNIEPDNVDALYGKGLALEALGKTDEAQTYFDKAEELEPTLQLIESMVICSLMIVPPFYDCSENWYIYIFDDISWDFCGGHGACAKWFPKRVYISLDQSHWVGQCGHKTLMHELNHLIYLNVTYCH